MAAPVVRIEPSGPDQVWGPGAQAFADGTEHLLAELEWLRCLIGFRARGPEYLWANFLDCPGAVEEIGDRLEVTLADTPLSLVFRMAGIETESYYVPWIGREICHRRQSE